MSAAGNVRAVAENEDRIGWGQQETGNATGTVGRNCRCRRGLAGTIAEKTGETQNKVQKSDLILAQLPTEQFLCCFEKVKENLQFCKTGFIFTCLFLPKLMGKIPHLPSKVKILPDPFTMFSTQLSLKLSSVSLLRLRLHHSCLFHYS